jgi:hypothetical protein
LSWPWAISFISGGILTALLLNEAEAGWAGWAAAVVAFFTGMLVEMLWPE